jgi:hypothetical protein
MIATTSDRLKHPSFRRSTYAKRVSRSPIAAEIKSRMSRDEISEIFSTGRNIWDQSTQQVVDSPMKRFRRDTEFL